MQFVQYILCPSFLAPLLQEQATIFSDVSAVQIHASFQKLTKDSFFYDKHSLGSCLTPHPALYLYGLLI